MRLLCPLCATWPTAITFTQEPRLCSFTAFRFHDGGQSSKAEIHSLRAYVFSVAVFITSTVFFTSDFYVPHHWGIASRSDWKVVGEISGALENSWVHAVDVDVTDLNLIDYASQEVIWVLWLQFLRKSIDETKPAYKYEQLIWPCFFPFIWISSI